MRTLIVDDHALFAEGLRLLLQGSALAGEVLTCHSGEVALQLAAAAPFDLILLDWNLGNGLGGAALLSDLKAVLPLSRVVIVSGENGAAVVRRAIEGGAVGFVPKASSPALLVDALTMAAHGGIYLPLTVMGVEPAAVAAEPAAAPSPVPAAARPLGGGALQRIAQAFPQLTPRHAEVLDHLARGMSNKQIARVLDISEGTVKQHLNTIFRELEVASRTEAVYLMAKKSVRFD